MIEEKLQINVKRLAKIDPFRIKDEFSEKEKVYIYRDLMQAYIEASIHSVYNKFNYSDAIGVGNSIKIRTADKFKLKIDAKDGKKEILFTTNNDEKDRPIYDKLIILQQVVDDFNNNRHIQFLSDVGIASRYAFTEFSIENNILQIYTPTGDLSQDYSIGLFNKEPIISNTDNIFYKIVKN